jgi:hypothetical protein
MSTRTLDEAKSHIFDRNLKMHQKKWASQRPEMHLAAGGLCDEIATSLLERVKVKTGIKAIILL